MVIQMEHNELRLGYVTDLYYKVAGISVPKQLDLLNDWFGSLIIRVRESDNTTKELPEFVDMERIIYATRYHGYLYSGGNNRVTHITGKLVGTTSSNLEKERRSAELIQKNISRKLALELQPIIDLYEHVDAIVKKLDEEKMNQFHTLLWNFVVDTAEAHYNKSEYERDSELFPFDDEVFDQILYNAFYQLTQYDVDGVRNGFLWLLLGSLLRNACGRVCRTFDSSFSPAHRPSTASGDLMDQLHFLANPDDYGSFYVGDDMDNRFPGIDWFCDNCQDYLNKQDGFDDHLPLWQCRKCGYVNIIDYDEIYENEEDARNHIHRHSKEDFINAIETRKKELEK